MSDNKLEPAWCEVSCESCGLGGRILITGWMDTHITEDKGSWLERTFESEEAEECVCGAVPETPPMEELAALYDHTVGAEEPPRHGWLTSTRRVS